MSAIDNSNLKDYLGSQGTSGFVPGLRYTYDASAAEIDFNDASAFPAGVGHKRTLIKVHDKFGNTAPGAIENPNGSESADDRTTTIDVSGLDRSKPLDITATVVADANHLIADGSAHDIGTSGTLSSWAINKNA